MEGWLGKPRLGSVWLPIIAIRCLRSSWYDHVGIHSPQVLLQEKLLSKAKDKTRRIEFPVGTYDILTSSPPPISFEALTPVLLLMLS